MITDKITKSNSPKFTYKFNNETFKQPNFPLKPQVYEHDIQDMLLTKKNSLERLHDFRKTIVKCHSLPIIKPGPIDSKINTRVSQMNITKRIK